MTKPCPDKTPEVWVDMYLKATSAQLKRIVAFEVGASGVPAPIDGEAPVTYRFRLFALVMKIVRSRV